MKMYADYVRERAGTELIVGDHGFVSYRLAADHIYVEDVFVAKERRDRREGSKLMEKLLKIAKEKQIHKLIAMTDLRSNNPGLGMRVMLSYGFEPYSCEKNLVYFMKEI